MKTKKAKPTRRDPGLVGTGREKWHGTVTGYQNHKCRCRKCKTGWAAYQKEYRERRLGGATCLVKNCKKKAWPSAGNGLCYTHTSLLREKRAKEAREKQRRKRRGTKHTSTRRRATRK